MSNGLDQIYVKDAGDKGTGLYSKEKLLKDDFVFEFIGTRVPLEDASQLSLQIDDQVALESSDEYNRIDDHINHSCDPNCKVVIKDDRVLVYALKDIDMDDELTFNYNSTEFDMLGQGCSFKCRCESQSCIGHVEGFRYLPPDQREAIKPLLLPYLLKMV